MNNLQNNKSFVKISLIYFILALIFISTSVIYVYCVNTKNSPEKITHNFQRSFLGAEQMLSSYLGMLAKNPSLAGHEHTDSLNEMLAAEPYILSFFKFHRDSLVYWSDHSVPLSESLTARPKNILNLSNGIYFYDDTTTAEYRIAGVFLIKQKYPYQNAYLENLFQRGFQAPQSVEIQTTLSNFNIYNSDLRFVFSLQYPANFKTAGPNAYIILLLYALAFVAIAASLFHLYRSFRHFLKSDLIFVLAFSIDIILIRGLMFIFKFPASLYSSELFSPGSFAASGIVPSLGDFLFNALALLAIAYVLFDTFRKVSSGQRRSLFGKYFLIFSLFLHIFIFYRLFLRAAESLIMDGSYSLNLNQFFFLSAESFLALLILTILLFSFFLVSYRILCLALYYSDSSPQRYFLMFALATAVYFLTCFLIHDCIFLLFLPVIIYALVFYFISKRSANTENIGFTGGVIYLFLFSILSAAILFSYNNKKEIEQRKLLAISLSSGEDHLSEYILKSVCDEMKQDSLLRDMLARSPYSIKSEDQAIKYIEDIYLIDRLRKYEWMLTICTPYRSLIIQPENDTVNCLEYFETLFKDFCRPGLGSQLYHYENEAGMSNYISRQDFILNDNNDTISVFIELYSFFIPEEGLGYPELLIDEKIRTFSGLEKYSYARFKNGKLVFKYGDYPYRTGVEAYMQDQANAFFHHNNSHHYIYQSAENEHVIISKNENRYLDIIAPLSYLLIFFTLFLLVFLIATNIPFHPIHFNLNFRNRLQSYIISLIIISFVIVGVITVRYVINLNTSKNKEILREKTHSVLIELEHKLAEESTLNAEMEEYLTNLLIKFSQVFFSDINLYDLHGRLLASSRPQIFQKNLISKRMSAEAFHSLTIEKKLLFIHTETIGDQDYFSAYVPFMNADSKVVAYLNLPYFAKQTELQSEISSFLNAFLNVYVLITAIAIFFALLISRFTTRPLQLIKDKMRSLSLSGTNEKISWSRDDEIGTLISEYNRMVEELTISAELLAKSERESAWREMARQVAHEIKNPLTPMKLSVQYLQKAWDEKSSDWDERLERFTKTIIEHIDTLSDIATEFSDFAKMPQKKEEKIDLKESIRNSLDLFSDIENIQFRLNDSGIGPHYVLADKNQLIRVFNNLIKNSVQAIGKKARGSISISIDRKNGMHEVSVKDNGPGIPDEMVDKIFSPSFTTKSSGMGLGLALVKNIIQEAGGEITFSSSPSTGTEFLIRLPVYS